MIVAATVAAALAVACGSVVLESEKRKPVYLGPMFLGYDLDDLPESPTIEQQIAAGERQVAALKERDHTLDSNRELYEYFNGIAARLVEHSEQRAPFPITIHVSKYPVANAQALPGGHIVVYERIFDWFENESELVALLGHEIAHQVNNDFTAFWSAYKNERQLFGADGLLEESQEIEAKADEDAARMMYAAGWDPRGIVTFFRRMHARSLLARGGREPSRSTHPRTRERIEALSKLVEEFPPKSGLVEDSEKFRELKRRQ